MQNAPPGKVCMSYLSVVQLSKDQAQEADTTVKSLRTSGTAFCSSMHQQLDQALLTCNALPAPARMSVQELHSPTAIAAKEYVTKLPQMLSLSRLNLTKHTA